MRYYKQPIYATKKRVKVSNGVYRYLQLYDKQTITKSGRITHHQYFVKYKGKDYKVERIGYTQTYQLKGKL